MQHVSRPEPDLHVPAAEGEAFTVLPGRLSGGLLILCDHASNALPAGYGTLGLPCAEFERHIAYDIGAAGVARHLARALDAPGVLTRVSRLLIDCNRGLDDPTLIMRLSDGTLIPANRAVSAEERKLRIASFHEPYHQAITRLIDQAIGFGVPPALVSIHSYTQEWRGQPRPWHAAVLWDKDPRLARPLIEILSQERGLVIGDNEPYSGRLKGDCMWRHGTMRGLAHAIIEVRQDLVREEAGQAAWGDRLAGVLKRLLAQGAVKHDLNRICHYGSHSD